MPELTPEDLLDASIGVGDYGLEHAKRARKAAQASIEQAIKALTQALDYSDKRLYPAALEIMAVAESSINIGRAAYQRILSEALVATSVQGMVPVNSDGTPRSIPDETASPPVDVDGSKRGYL